MFGLGNKLIIRFLGRKTGRRGKGGRGGGEFGVGEGRKGGKGLSKQG